MKLTTKRNRWYFWRELFLYMIPLILIVGVIDIFRNFMVCPLHPEWSAPCNINWILAAIYGVFLLLVIIFAIISAIMLKKVKKKIEIEFMEAANHTVNKAKAVVESEEKIENIKKMKIIKPGKIIVKSDKKEPKKVTKKESKKIDNKELKENKTPVKKKSKK